MKVYRTSKGETEHYTSFEELGKAWGCKIKRKQTKDKNKLQKQREDFCGRHICNACKKPMEFDGGNLMVCKNPDCNGIKNEKILDSGEKKIWYTPSYDLLDDRSASIAENIFAEYED